MEQDFRTTYRLLTSAVIPRPIGFISSQSESGISNLAPYSYFNAVSSSPPVIMFSATDQEGELKHTPRNILEQEEFVFNLVTESIAERMDQTAVTLPRNESEFEFAGLRRAECEKVSVPRVAEAPVALECTFHKSVEIYSNTVIFGEVIYAHVDDDLLTEGKIDVTKIDAVGRLSGPYYTGIDRLDLERSH